MTTRTAILEFPTWDKANAYLKEVRPYKHSFDSKGRFVCYGLTDFQIEKACDHDGKIISPDDCTCVEI